MTRTKRFVVLGDAGAGKSAFINAMYNYCYGTRNADEVFKSEASSALKLVIPCKGWTDLVAPNNPSSERDINDQTKSQTMTSNTYSLQLNEDLVLELIDTPGFNDTEGISSDESNLEQIDKVLCELPFLSGIIIVANGALVRLGTSFQHFLYLLHEIWPNNLMNNICVVLTNCNELSCNLDSNTLRQLLNVTDKTMFRIRNNIFRWDRTMHSDIRRFRQNFEDVIDTIDKLVPVLEEFNDVSTEDFNMSNIQQSLINKSIQELIECMMSLLDANQDQTNAKYGILNANSTMQANKNWQKQYEISAIRWMEVPVDQALEVSSDDSEVQKMTSKGNSISMAKKIIHSVASLPTKLINKIGNSYNKGSSLDTKPKEKIKQSTDQQVSCQNPDGHSKISANSCSTCPNAFPQQDSQSLSSGTKTNNNIKPDASTILSKQNTIPTYKAEEIKVQLTLPDNVAISHHEDARKQACDLGNKVENLEKKQETLRHELDSLLEQLTIHVREMREINKHVDLVQKHKDILTKFSEKIKMMDNVLDMSHYFDKTISILNKPSTTSESPTASPIPAIEQMETDV